MPLVLNKQTKSDEIIINHNGENLKIRIRHINCDGDVPMVNLSFDGPRSFEITGIKSDPHNK